MLIQMYYRYRYTILALQYRNVTAGSLYLYKWMLVLMQRQGQTQAQQGASTVARFQGFDETLKTTLPTPTPHTSPSSATCSLQPVACCEL